MRRIKELVEVEILKNFSSLFLILLRFKVFFVPRPLTALMTSFLVRTDTLANEAFIARTLIVQLVRQLRVLDQLMKAVTASMVTPLNVSRVFLAASRPIFQICIRTGLTVLVAVTEVELSIY